MAKKYCNMAPCLQKILLYSDVPHAGSPTTTSSLGLWPIISPCWQVTALQRSFLLNIFLWFCVLGFAILDLLLVYVAELQDPKKTSKSIKSKKASDSLRIKLLRKSSAPSSTPPNPNLYRRWPILFFLNRWQILLFSARDSTALSHKTRWLYSWRRTWPPAWSTSLCPRSPPPPSPPLPFSPSTWEFWHLGPFSFGVTRLCSSFGSDSLQTNVPKSLMWEVMHTQSFFELFDNKIGHCFK